MAWYSNPDAWQDLIDQYLVEWASDPSQLEDDDIFAPTKETIEFAISLALSCKTMGMPCPTRVVLDGDGGIVFERIQGGSVVQSTREQNTSRSNMLRWASLGNRISLQRSLRVRCSAKVSK
jgi:hypothetical protein